MSILKSKKSVDEQITDLKKQIEILELEKEVEELKGEIKDIKDGKRREIWIGGEGYPAYYTISYNPNDFCSG